MIRDVRQPNRTAPTWRQIVNPLWLLSDDLRNPAWPRSPTVWWLFWWSLLLRIPGARWACWFSRNPAANLCAVVLGLCHRRREVVWRSGPGWTFVPVGGINYGWSIPIGGRLPRPFISYRGARFEIASGWKTSGALSLLSVRRANSPNAEDA